MASPRRQRSVLWLVHQPPLPAVNGSRVRSLSLIRQLAARGWNISLFSLGSGVAPGAADVAELSALCSEIRLGRPAGTIPMRLMRQGTDLLRGRPYHHSRFRSRTSVREAHGWINASNFDAIVVVGLAMLPFVPRSALGRTLLDTQNVESERIGTMAREMRPRPRRLAARAQQRVTRRYEHQAATDVAGVIAVSEYDGRWFERAAPGRVTTVANGVDCQSLAPRLQPRLEGSVLFVGSMDYSPNVACVEVLLTEIAPRLQARPVRITLVGGMPPRSLRKAAARAPMPVEVVGCVADVGPWFHRSRVLAVPLRVGGGTRLKVLEAMAHGVPVVTTSLGCRGLEVDHLREVIIADDYSDFARWVDTLLTNDAIAQRLGERARKLVRARYDWSLSGNSLEAALDGIAYKDA